VHPSKDSFGKRVRDLRKKQGLSQEALALKAGLHRTYISSVERGKRNISLESIVKLVRALNCSAGDLLDKEPQ